MDVGFFNTKRNYRPKLPGKYFFILIYVFILDNLFTINRYCFLQASECYH